MSEKNEHGRAAGGRARAKALTPEQRKAAARKAAEARWGPKQEEGHPDYPTVTHRGLIKIADVELPCFILDDGRRVISGRGMTAAIGMKGRGQGAQRISEHRAIKPFLDNDLAVAISTPILFTGASPRGNAPSSGFEAIILQELCEVLLRARDAGALQTEQERRYAQFADMLIRSFARLGIIALVDEATGYQRERASDALAKILEAFIAKELQPWIKTFPDEFYEEMFRLRGLQYPHETVKRPQYFGHLTNDIIYKRIAPGVLEELKKSAPKLPSGRRKGNLTQKLTPEFGHPKLREHLASVTTIMSLSDDYTDFKRKLDKRHPRYDQSGSFDFEDGDDTGL
ncbi:MAG TPA: P63C domain-containing protein [Pseudorhizobium sp.]|nr:P63C domain-containing protein [Pseudorhizobium sp.]